MNVLKIKFHSISKKKNLQNINTKHQRIKLEPNSIYLCFQRAYFQRIFNFEWKLLSTSHIWPTTANVSVPIHISKSIVLDHEGGRSRRTGNVAFTHGTRSIFVLKEQLDVDFVASTCRRCDSFRFSFLMHFQVHRAKGNSQTLISRSFHEAQRMDSMKWVHIYIFASRLIKTIERNGVSRAN